MPKEAIVKNDIDSPIAKVPKPDIIKKIISVFVIVFVLFIIPVTVNLSLRNQDPRSSAQVITDQAATDSSVPTSTTSSTTTIKEKSFIENAWGYYPFIIGIILIIWASLIFIYFGLKFKKKL